MPSNFGTPPGMGFDFMFRLVPIFIIVVFVIVIVGILFNSARYLKNVRSPRESIYARVVAKRMDVRTRVNHHHTNQQHAHISPTSRTHYFITLEFENGERREYLDTKNLYGLVVEGDVGYAAIQGDWIVAFERNVPAPLS